MKRLVSLLFVSLLFGLVSCAPLHRPVLSTPTQAPIDYHFDDFISNNEGDFFYSACRGKANWVKAPGVTFFSSDYNRETNPTTVTVTVNRVVEIDGYIVNFNTHGSTTVYKNMEEIIGDERDQAIFLALKQVEGIPNLLVIFTLKQNDGGFAAYDFTCSLP